MNTQLSDIVHVIKDKLDRELSFIWLSKAFYAGVSETLPKEYFQDLIDDAENFNYFDITDHGFNNLSQEDRDDLESLHDSIRYFLCQNVGSDIYYYLLDKCANGANVFLFIDESGIHTEILRKAIERSDLDAFKVVWGILHQSRFNSCEREEIYHYTYSHEILDDLFYLSTKLGQKSIFDYLVEYAEPKNYKTLFYLLRDKDDK